MVITIDKEMAWRIVLTIGCLVSSVCLSFCLAKIRELESDAVSPTSTPSAIKRALRRIGLGKPSINYIMTKAEEDDESPAQIIDELVQKELTGAMP